MWGDDPSSGVVCGNSSRLVETWCSVSGDGLSCCLCCEFFSALMEAPVAVEVVVIVAMVAMVFGKTPIPVVVALEVGSES